MTFHILLFIPAVAFSASIYEYYFDGIDQHKQLFYATLRDTHVETEDYPVSRILTTVSCPDCDAIPKVKDAGKIFLDRNVAYQLMHNGVRVLKDGYCGEWMTDLIYGLKGHHEPQEERVFHEILEYIPANGTMIELGSYWAYYSLWFAQKIPQANTYLIEPVEKNLNLSKKNFELNNQKGHFYHAFVAVEEPGQDYTGASKISIDSFLDTEEITHINLLHSDIQGAELEMLKSCARAIERGCIDYFFISTHSEIIHKNCLNYLIDTEHFIIAEHSPHESYSVDGLIVARRKSLLGPSEIEISKAYKR